MGLQRCSICTTKTKVIGGPCTGLTHKDLAKEIKARKKRDKELVDAAKKKARVVTCKCGCWGKLKPGDSIPLSGDKDDSIPISKMTPEAIKISKVAGRCHRYGHDAVDVRALQISDGQCDICAGIAGVHCSGKHHCNCIDGPYVLRHCNKHGSAAGKPTIMPGHTYCNGCRDDIKLSSHRCHILRKKKRNTDYHRLRSQLSPLDVEVLEQKFNQICLMNLKPAGVTHELKKIHGGCNFVYDTVDLQQLYRNYRKSKFIYPTTKKKKTSVTASKSVVL